MTAACKKVEDGDNLSFPVALTLPSGRPPKNASKRRRSGRNEGPRTKTVLTVALFAATRRTPQRIVNFVKRLRKN